MPDTGRRVERYGDMGGMGTGAPALDKMQSSGATVGQAHPHGYNQTASHRRIKL